jgi:3,4-dihydroxy 2-butanone 4-phosphate synthase/GTP cyclohydrolase II
MAREARGLICITLTRPALDRLGIPMMVAAGQNNSGFGSPFTVSVEARTGVTTGISAHDRARTIQVLIDPASTAADIAMPGHMFPLRAHPNGVLARRGHTEAGVDLTRLAGLTPAAVICEIMAEDGAMARLPALRRFAAAHRLKIISIEALAHYRLQHDTQPPIPRTDSATAHALQSI